MRLKPESRSFALDTFPPTLAGSSSLNVDLWVFIHSTYKQAVFLKYFLE
jgi:hypothetical protein